MLDLIPVIKYILLILGFSYPKKIIIKHDRTLSVDNVGSNAQTKKKWALSRIYYINISRKIYNKVISKSSLWLRQEDSCQSTSRGQGFKIWSCKRTWNYGRTNRYVCFKTKWISKIIIHKEMPEYVLFLCIVIQCFK